MVFLFCRLTRYNDWEEIQRGNVAAALALGGKVLGLANVMRFAIMSNMGAVEIVAWGMAGMVLLLLVYLAFEWLTPRLKVNEEIAGGNVAVGALSMVFSLAASLIIGASIS
ncbi:DUF350 domain-containing protein [Desulfofundulus thermobenzoicus]|uniref:DUF350 domain-containing protein n=2 Tax=Desulfofundulus thermobenzoicus TaxID=29376 RepID=A0A6N7ILE3_9FIRM|nr:DUF350 domain-containing protein [Desulfofundulus thermobenzoicus]HHW44520.1 DUF350 domain-containing protein [Desulfotomaculum sp.]